MLILTYFLIIENQCRQKIKKGLKESKIYIFNIYIIQINFL